MRRYLLGELSESERSALEEQYFTDPQVFDQVLKVESELADGYARGQLANDVRERFEQSYMAHPARSARAKFAEALAIRLDQTEESVSGQTRLPASWWQRLLTSIRGQRPTLRFSIAFATLLIVLGGVWFFIASRQQQQHGELAQNQAAQEARRQLTERESAPQSTDDDKRAEDVSTADQGRVEGSPKQTPQPAPTPPLRPAPPSVSLALTFGGVRGSDTGRTPTLVIPRGTAQVRLLLNMKQDDYSGYQASLQSVEGAEIFSQRSVKPRRAKTGASLVFTVPARQLESGDYVLTLRVVGPDGEVDDLSKSLFRVEKR